MTYDPPEPDVLQAWADAENDPQEPDADTKFVFGPYSDEWQAAHNYPDPAEIAPPHKGVIAASLEGGETDDGRVGSESQDARVRGETRP